MKKKKDNSYVVYLHTLKSDGRKYVGITCQNPHKRWSYGKGYLGQSHFYNAISKYGWDNFKHEIVFENLTEDQACTKEIALIKLFKSNNPEYGFNITEGGEHCCIAESTKEKLSKTKTKWVIDKNILYNLYIVQNKTAKECAIILKVPVTAVHNNLTKYGFRKTEEQLKLVAETTGLNKCKVIPKDELKYLYIDLDWTQKQCAKYFGCHKDLISQRLKEYGINKKQKIDIAELTHLRIDLKKSLQECANYFGYTDSGISYILKKYNIKEV